eukprot:TRINITY_DN6531_c1_g1_i1.p1 TRINITY_DN6531_c1_g1~~TRINITY_DN6531_c1_g1_i1.p1  ORF type:complete len:414 (+),score=36.29 TRINITY_DN6531_c1_g1_i1:105-1346(+)
MAGKARWLWKALTVIWLTAVLGLFTAVEWSRRVVTDVQIGRIVSNGHMKEKLEGVALRTTSERMFWFECRMTVPGGGIFVCECNRVGPKHYLITSRTVPHSGYYTISLTIAHYGEHGADPTPPIANQYEGIELATHTVFIESTATVCIPHWKSKQTYQDCLPNTNVILPNIIKAPIILVGDSHMRGWRDVLTAAEGFSEPYHRLDGLLSPGGSGLISYIRVESLQVTTKTNSTSIPKYLRHGFDHTFHQLDQLHERINLLKKTSKDIVVAVNFGSWDLRDVPVATYCENLKIFENKFSAMGFYALGVKLIWRSTPPYTYRGNNYRTNDLRTNEKIKLANSCARAILPKWIHHDTFEVAYPVFMSSCDTHHYLCPPSRERESVCPLVSASQKTIGVGCAGKADLLTFLKTAFPA